MNHISKMLNGPGGTASPGPLPIPGWTPPPPASPEEIRIEQDLLRKIQRELPRVNEGLDKAVQELVALKVSEESFTAFTYSLAVAYNEVEAFTLRELRHRAEETVVIQGGVGYSAAAWEAAEEASAPRMV